MDGVVIVPLAEVDVDAVAAFFGRIPDGDRTFFKEPVLGTDTIRDWLREQGRVRLVASRGGEVVGYAAVIPLVGWSSHVGELRLVVDPGVRRHGIGLLLARHALAAALELGLAKVVVEVVADQESTIALFTGLGFVAEALLEDQVRNAGGAFSDLIVLAHRTEDNWRLLATVGLGQPLD